MASKVHKLAKEYCPDKSIQLAFKAGYAAAQPKWEKMDSAPKYILVLTVTKDGLYELDCHPFNIKAERWTYIPVYVPEK